MSDQYGQPLQQYPQQPPYGQQPQWPTQQPYAQPQWGQQPPSQYGQPQQPQWPTQQQYDGQPMPNYAPQQQWPAQQPPMYPPQPPMSQQPRPKRKRWLIVGIVAAVAFFVCIGSVFASQHNNTGTVVQNSQGSGSNNTSPTTPHFKVGQVVKVGDTWDVTINSVKTSKGQGFDTPKAGTIYLLIDVSLKNISSGEQAVSSLAMFTLRDSTGQEYTESITTFTKPPDGKVEAGAPLRGTLVYEVPPSQHGFTFAFTPDITSTGQSIWDVKV